MQLIDKIVARLRDAEDGWRGGLLAVAPLAATAVLVIAIAAQLAALLWRVVAPPVTPVTDGGGAPLPAAPSVDLASIVNAHLFGVVAAGAVDPASAPATTANLTLAGTLASPDPEQGWAIIGAAGQSARVYATGATLPGGARLAAVYADRVILDRGGARESLALPRLSGGGAVPTAYAPVGLPAPSLADNVRELLAQNPSAISQVMRPQPVFAGGQQRGYRVYPGRDRAQFARLGLQPGDLVTAVNGMPLDDPNRGLEALNGVGMGGAVTLTIERNGQVQQLSVDSSSVMQPGAPAPEPDPSGNATE